MTTPAEHARRVAFLEEAGWVRDGDEWVLDVSESRWSTIAFERIGGGSFEDATRSAYFRQMNLDALEIRAEQQRH